MIPDFVLDWRDEARCAETNPDAFFPVKGGSAREAIAICSDCPVAVQCLQFAVDTEQLTGVWGGLTAWERRKIRVAAERRKVTAAA
jgi:WhiB family redox-sensing transcriptional regulator